MPVSNPERTPPADASAILDAMVEARDLPSRVDALSARLLGSPYVSFPLIGSAVEPEQLVTRLDGFDCVTFVETVLALAWSRTADEFPALLAAIRYRDGRVSWIERNHYMSTWLDRNSAEGRFAPVLEREWIAEDTARELSVLATYPALSWYPRYLPMRALPRLDAHARAGDVVGFVSPRRDLDTAHVGLLFPHPEGVRLRHAGRARGEVVEQPLTEYLAHVSAPGAWVARPLPRRSP